MSNSKSGQGNGAHAPEPEVALETDQALLERFEHSRLPELREELAARYLPLAERLAMRYRNPGENDEDLLQVASLGLLKAIDGFDSSHGARFESYATPTILGELRRHFRDRTWAVRVPRDLKEAIPKIREAINELAIEKGSMPEPEEIAEKVELEPEVVEEVLIVVETARPKSLDAPVAPGETGEVAVLADRIGEEEDLYEETEYAVMLEQRLDALDDRDREVLYLRFARDMTQDEIAEQIGVSQMQVSRILRAALDTLRKE